MPFTYYSTFAVRTVNGDCSGTWTNCHVTYAGSFLVIENKDRGTTVIPAHLVILAHGTEARC